MRPVRDVHSRAWEAVVTLFRCGTGMPETNIAGRFGTDALACLRGLRALEADTPLKTVLCPCCAGEVIDVEENMDTGELSGYCPECMEVPVRSEALRRWKLRRNWLPTEIAAAFGITAMRSADPRNGVSVIGRYGKRLIAIGRDISRILMDKGLLSELRPSGHEQPMIISTRPGRTSEFLNPVGAVFVPLESSFTLGRNGLSYVDYVTPEEPMAVVNGFSPDFIDYYEGGRKVVEFTPKQADIFRTMGGEKAPCAMKEILEKAGTQYRTFHEAFKVRRGGRSHAVELARNEIAFRVIKERANGLYVLEP